MTAESDSLFGLHDRVVVVTGGNRGIGRAMALGLARAGASAAVLARNAEQNQLVLETIETHLSASFLLSQLVAKSMVEPKSGGKIINLWIVGIRFAE